MADFNSVSRSLAIPSAAGWVAQTLAPSPAINSVGGLVTATYGGTLFTDVFDGTTLDTTYRWNSPVLGGAGAVSQLSGALAIIPGAVASAAAAVSSQETFIGASITPLLIGCAMLFEAGISTNTHRFFGVGTPNGSYTAATPLQDAAGFEIDITGALNCVTYAGGVRTIWRTLPLPTDGGFHLYLVRVRTDLVQFYFDNADLPIASAAGNLFSNSRLPVRIHAVNHTSGPAAAPTMLISGMGVNDTSGTYQSVWNGQSFTVARSPGVFIPINATLITAETAVWTPASGKRFRLQGYVLAGGVVGGNVVLKDGTGGTTRLVIPLLTVGTPIPSPPMGNGIFSIAANNALTATGVATQTLNGYLYGCEE